MRFFVFAPLCLLSLACYPASTHAVVPRTSVGTDQAHLTAVLEGPNAQEPAAAGLPRETVVDDAFLLEAGSSRTCVGVVTRSAPKMDLDPAAWTIELDGAPAAFDGKDDALARYPYVVAAAEANAPKPGETPTVVVHRGVVCGQPLGSEKTVSLTIRFRLEGAEWYERFVWDLE